MLRLASLRIPSEESPNKGGRRQASNRGPQPVEINQQQGYRWLSGFWTTTQSKNPAQTHVLHICVYNTSISQTTQVIHSDLLYLLHPKF